MAVLGLVAQTGYSQVTSHYPAGIEGIKGPSLPPPGFYYRDYTYYYTSNDLMGPGGESAPVDFEADVLVKLIRPVYMTDWNILGGRYGMDLVVPLFYSDISVDTPAGSFGGSGFEVGDILVDPLYIAWNTPRWDIGIGYGFFAPTADYDPTDLASPGKGHFTHLLTAGATYYLDPEKEWSFGLLNRWEIAGENDDSNVTNGQAWTMEWGLSKKIGEGLDIGLSGYSQWQITDDRGSGVTWDRSVHDERHAIGPEISGFIKPWNSFLSARWVHEFGVEDRPEGDAFCITLTKIF